MYDVGKTQPTEWHKQVRRTNIEAGGSAAYRTGGVGSAVLNTSSAEPLECRIQSTEYFARLPLS
jgi:hypothetical protein